MIDDKERLYQELQKSKSEFDIASTCLIQALQAFNERMERVEKWIEHQKGLKTN
jgi:hypothetical protein